MYKQRLFAIVIGLSFLITAVVTVPATTYTGTNAGAIPDGTGSQPSCGAPRDIVFNVTGFPGQVGSSSISFTMSPQHTWAGDLTVSLIAPDATTHLLFSRIGANNATDFGDNANFDGTYVFNDLATANIWTVAASNNGSNFDITPGSYRTQAAGPFANDSPGPAFTGMNTTFSAVPAASVNGTWTLRFLDCANGDTGTVSAAALTLNPLAAGGAALEGRVRTAYGAGIRGAVVTISGGNLAEPKSVVTGTFGYYSFPDITVGQTYLVSVQAKKFTFSQPAFLVGLEQDLHEVDFVAN